MEKRQTRENQENTSTRAEIEREIAELKAEVIAGDAEHGISCLDISKEENAWIPLRSLDSVEEKDVEWLVPEYIPKGQITIMAGDGGAGKTTIWCSIAAAISTGEKVFFEKTPKDFAKGEPGKVIFFSSEDSVEHVLKKRLRTAGADMRNISFIGLDEDRFSQLKFNSELLKQIVRQEKPKLVIFDPLQSFIPEGAEMSKRNAMRSVLNPLIGLGEETGATFLIVLHTNKRGSVSGRYRIADSADIWDIARSALIVGNDPESEAHYISQEKSNYGVPGQTALFRIEGGKAAFEAYTDKKDYDFVSERPETVRNSPQREEAKEFILEFLKDTEQAVTDLNEAAKAAGLGERTVERARSELKQAGLIVSRCEGFRPKKWYLSLAGTEDNSD